MRKILIALSLSLALGLTITPIITPPPPPGACDPTKGEDDCDIPWTI